MKQSKRLRVVAENLRSFWGPGFVLDKKDRKIAKIAKIAEEDARTLIDIAELLEAQGL